MYIPRLVSLETSRSRSRSRHERERVNRPSDYTSRRQVCGPDHHIRREVPGSMHSHGRGPITAETFRTLSGANRGAPTYGVPAVKIAERGRPLSRVARSSPPASIPDTPRTFRDKKSAGASGCRPFTSRDSRSPPQCHFPYFTYTDSRLAVSSEALDPVP